MKTHTFITFCVSLFHFFSLSVSASLPSLLLLSVSVSSLWVTAPKPSPLQWQQHQHHQQQQQQQHQRRLLTFNTSYKLICRRKKVYFYFLADKRENKTNLGENFSL